MEHASTFQAIDVATQHVETGRVRLVETEHRPDATTGWHSHPGLRLCLVVAGGFEEADPRGSWYRGPGTLLLYPAHTDHDNRFSHHGARCLNIEVPATEQRAAKANRREKVFQLALPEARLGMQIYDKLRRGHEGRGLGSLTRELVSAVRRADPGVAPPSPGWLERARQLVEQRAADGINLSELADALEISPFVVARRFRQHTGCSVGEYRHQVLIQRALETWPAWDRGC